MTNRMASPDATDFRLSVLNPGGRELEQYFDEPVGPTDTGHPPINLHAFAACTRGSFHRKTKNAIAEKRPVLLILRGNFRATERALVTCQKENRTVAVVLKETGLHQIAEQLHDPGRLARFMRVVGRADGCIATTPEAAEIFRRARPERDGNTAAFIPTPYPLEDKQWNFVVPPNEQSGIFIGTREWDVPSRNHLSALLLAREICVASGEPVTVFNLDGRKGEKLLAELQFPPGKLRIRDKRESYADYLGEVAKHKIVLQLDRSRVPGQVAGDALLCRTVCVGGDGAIERIAFPKTCSVGREIGEIASIALELLKNAESRAEMVADSQKHALKRLSFQAVHSQLAEFFARLANGK